MLMENKNDKVLLRIWTILFVLLLILLMAVPARADIEPRYYGNTSVPFYLYKKSEVKIFLHSSNKLRKALVGTFVLDKGHQKVKTLKDGIYSVKISDPPLLVRRKSVLSKKALAELKLSALLREVKKEQVVVSQ